MVRRVIVVHYDQYKTKKVCASSLLANWALHLCVTFWSGHHKLTCLLLMCSRDQKAEVETRDK